MALFKAFCCLYIHKCGHPTINTTKNDSYQMPKFFQVITCNTVLRRHRYSLTTSSRGVSGSPMKVECAMRNCMLSISKSLSR